MTSKLEEQGCPEPAALGGASYTTRRSHTKTTLWSSIVSLEGRPPQQTAVSWHLYRGGMGHESMEA